MNSNTGLATPMAVPTCEVCEEPLPEHRHGFCCHDCWLEVLDAMQRFGGGFVAALSVAWLKADPLNDERLRTAFDRYWNEYAGAVRDRKARGMD